MQIQQYGYQFNKIANLQSKQITYFLVCSVYMSTIPQSYLQQMQKLQRDKLLRNRHEITRMPNGYIIKNGKTLVSFCDNDYLGLSFFPELQRAAINAMAKYGSGATASRLITGNHPLYTMCEHKIANIKQSEDALLFGSGYLANLGVITSLARTGDLIIADRLIHASLIDAISLSGATLKRFRHNDTEHATQLLHKYRAEYRNCLLVTETVFSMDGDIAPITPLSILAANYDSILVVDDAHGLGIIKHEYNSCSAFMLQIGTFSKAAASYGGYVCASSKWVDYLLNHSRSLIYTTGLPPAVVATNIAAIDIIEQNPELGVRAMENATQFCEITGIRAPQSAIVPIVVGKAETAIKISKMLEEYGFLVAAIRPPTVPKNTARLRFTFSASHKKRDVINLAHTVNKILHKERVGL